MHVPFGCGLSFQVSQAHNVGSHLDNDTWAWDFRMPVGTPITAAREGVVRMARGDSTKGGCDPEFAKDANYVVIDHGDGTEAQYLHFSSVVVKAGQKVHAGELIGFSGETGWACGAHLHFKIAKHVHNGWNNPSIPATIEGYGDPQTATLIKAPTCPAKPTDIIQASAKDTNQTPPTVQAADALPKKDDHLTAAALNDTVVPAAAVVTPPVGKGASAAAKIRHVAGAALPDYTVPGSVAH